MHQFLDKLLPALLKNILLAQLLFTATLLEHERNDYFSPQCFTSHLQRSINFSGAKI